MTANNRPIKLLQFKELAAHGVTFQRRHLLTLESQKKFPQRVRLGENTIAWVEREIDDYVAARVTARAA